MKKNFNKKLILIMLSPICASIIGWAGWMTKQAFSAQKIEIVIENYKKEGNIERDFIKNQLDKIDNKMDFLSSKVDLNYQILSNKIEDNTKSTNKILLDLQKQIGDIK